MTFEIGDWVHGRTEAGELVQGYIESIHEMQDLISVNVLRSDNEEIVGTMVKVAKNRLKRTPMISLKEESRIRVLIDLALAAHDEAWFMELTDQLQTISKGKEKIGKLPDAVTIPVNRLGLPRIK
ncbi:IDEAL domain-containing protein [Paenibacillus sedimenti]|uniref:IDEAL domain-containing protein n=1 Tax=Paenibacillus sedimenti TaxID=2770274 RepID=A0A926KRB1_9BACL|nr:IDEAL domain-containing protein [Paenibacillus sedimenti]MBD0380873.1 IDEAL domain-containing protein [Paenibacillus sedimenti]